MAPSIQRRLIVTAADKKDADSMLRLLEGPSGLSLKRDPKTGEVTATVKNAKPPSPSLAAELLGIINDKKTGCGDRGRTRRPQRDEHQFRRVPG